MDDYTSVVNAFEELIKYNAGMIEATGDSPNFEKLVNSESVLWKSIDTKGGYDYQVNILSGKCKSEEELVDFLTKLRF